MVVRTLRLGSVGGCAKTLAHPFFQFISQKSRAKGDMEIASLIFLSAMPICASTVLTDMFILSAICW